MTLYRLWAAKVVEENPSVYFEADVEFIQAVSEDIDLPIGDLLEVRDEAMQSFQGQEVSDRAEKLIATVFIGDMDWYQLLEEWLPFPFNDAFTVMDAKVHKVGKDTAKKYGSLENLDLPEFSRPEDVRVAGELPTELTQNPVDQYVLTVALLDLEWYVYAAEQMDLEVDQEFIEKAKEETLEYFTGSREQFSGDLGSFQASLLINAAIWCEQILNDFEFNSKFLEKTSNILREEAEQIKNS